MAMLTFIGGAQKVTGSCYLLEIGEHRLLLDCGLHQGSNIVKSLHKQQFDFDIHSVDAVVLSHAHLDHSGMLPLLINHGYKGVIYCAEPTQELIPIMLEDSAGIYLRDLEWENRHRIRAGKGEWDAEYTLDDVNSVQQQCEAIAYDTQVELFDGIKLKFLDAGHILGSGIVELQFAERGKSKKLVFSGDLGNPETVLMNDPAFVDSADVVLMEGTYGDRDHKNMADTIEELAEIVQAAQATGGNVLIPSFALGRTQEILFHLSVLYRQGRLPQQRIFLDSPMAIEITKLYGRCLECLDEEDLQKINYVHGKLFTDTLPPLQYSSSVEESMAINRIEGGAIIIAGSGMCNGGRIKHHLKHNIWKDNAHLVFIGFQAQGTLGRLLVDGAKTVKMFGSVFAVKARIHTLGGFSAHAGQSLLLDWASRIQGEPRIQLVHGDPEALEVLASALWEKHQIRADIPAPGSRINF